MKFFRRNAISKSRSDDFSRFRTRTTEVVTTRGRFAWVWLGLVLLLGSFITPAWAQEGGLEAQPEVDYVFGERITFRVSFPSEMSIAGVEVLFQANSDPTVVEPAVEVNGVWTYEHDVQARYVRAYGTVAYWFRVTLTSGETQETERFSFFYEDNRFVWQTLEGVPFRVHWNTGDTAFAQAVLDAARAGAQQAGLILDTEFSESVDVYVYGQLTDYQFARDAMGPLWAGGHADPEAGVIVVSLPPGENQTLEIERKIPHEVAHLLLYQAAGEGFWNLPAWLNEGFASTMERNPNPDYETLVDSAVQKGTLLPLETLCQPFPRDAAGAVLAYAESTLFIRYIQTRFGQEGIRAMVHAYANGAGCELGTNVEPIHLSLTQLELEWREGPLAENVTLTALRELAPWLVLLGAVVAGPLMVVFSFRKPMN